MPESDNALFEKYLNQSEELLDFCEEQEWPVIDAVSTMCMVLGNILAQLDNPDRMAVQLRGMIRASYLHHAKALQKIDQSLN